MVLARDGAIRGNGNDLPHRQEKSVLRWSQRIFDKFDRGSRLFPGKTHPEEQSRLFPKQLVTGSRFLDDNIPYSASMSWMNRQQSVALSCWVANTDVWILGQRDARFTTSCRVQKKQSCGMRRIIPVHLSGFQRSKCSTTAYD